MTEKNVYGHFVLKNGIKTYLNFDTNGRFNYFQLNPLNPLFHKGDFVMTEGSWTFQDDGFITLNSLTENKTHQKITIEKVNTASISLFTFFNLLGDTLEISGASKNREWFGRVHNLMKSFELNLSKGDTVTADLNGYDKFRFVYSDTSQFVYHIVLYPNYVADYYKNKKLLLRRNKIIDPELKETYRKKSGM